MPTRQEVLDEIIGIINPGGNNTAEEVHEAFRKVLEFVEENQTGGGGGLNLETFNITEKELPSTKDPKVLLGFSFRGFRKFHGNLTFNLSFEKIDPGNRDFIFEVSDKVSTIFKELGIHPKSPRLAFVVPMIFSGDDKDHLPIIIHIGFRDNNLLWLEVNHRFDNMDGKVTVSSSIHFHLPENANN